MYGDEGLIFFCDVDGCGETITTETEDTDEAYKKVRRAGWFIIRHIEEARSGGDQPLKITVTDLECPIHHVLIAVA